MTMIGLPARRTAWAKWRSAPVRPARASTTNRIASQSMRAISVCARMRPASVSGSHSSRPAVSIMVKDRSAILPSPSRRSRVTPGSSSTSASLRPTSRLNSVDLPTFGRPMIATFGKLTSTRPHPEVALRKRGPRRMVQLAPRNLQTCASFEAASRRLRTRSEARPLLRRRRSVRGDKAEPAARRLPLARRDFGIAQHEIELLGGVVIVLAFERQGADRERGQAPIGSAGGRKRGQRRFALLLLAGHVHPQERGAQARAVAQQRIDRRVAADGVEGADRALRVPARLSAGRGHLRERPVAARALRRDLVETGFCLLGLAGFERGQRLLELVAGRLRGPFALILPIAKTRRGEHDQHGGGQDLVLVFLPEFRRLVAPDFLVNFLKDVAHCARGLSQRPGESERWERRVVS